MVNAHFNRETQNWLSIPSPWTDVWPAAVYGEGENAEWVFGLMYFKFKDTGFVHLEFLYAGNDNNTPSHSVA